MTAVLRRKLSLYSFGSEALLIVLLVLRDSTRSEEYPDIGVCCRRPTKLWYFAFLLEITRFKAQRRNIAPSSIQLQGYLCRSFSLGEDHRRR